MTATAKGGSSPLAGLVGDFRALKPKHWAGILVGLVLAVVLEVFMGTNCFGFLIVAIVLYMVPHLLGVSSVKVKAVTGALFAIIVLLIGTFAFTGGLTGLQQESDPDDQIGDVTITDDSITFQYKLEDGEILRVATGTINAAVYGTPAGYTSIVHHLAPLAEGADAPPESWTVRYDMVTSGPDADGWCTATVSDLDLEPGQLSLVEISVSTSYTSSPEAYYSKTVDNDGNTYYISLYGCAYYLFVTMVIFLIILVFSHWMRSSAEKTRKRMEAEGRLYPKGYGLCKQCGATVLPGEVNCRKCGAYIDVPDELKPKKKDFFQCSECGAEVPSDATECPRCGARFDEVENEVVHSDGSVDTSTDDVTCPDCGSTVPANAEWCPRCGKMLGKD